MKPSVFRIPAMIFLAITLSGCQTSQTTPTPPPATSTTPPLPSPTTTASPVPPTPRRISVIHLRSPSFSSGSEFPVKYTCDGEGVSPPLYWDTPPNGTQSYAIILSNPDSTSGSGWAYWVLFNIPADLRELPEAVPPEPELDDGTQHGRNSEMWLRYTGPCPPFTQRCLFRLYALDTMLDLEPGVSKEELLQAMQSHILAQGDLMTKYKRLK